MLLALWSSKGGSGTSVLAAACSLVLARHHSRPGDAASAVTLVDLAGDQPAVLGLPADPEPGLAEWLALGPEAPPEALDRLAVDAAPGVRLLPRGLAAAVLAPPLLAEAGAALAVSLPDGPAVADLGTAAGAPERAVAEVADRSVLVLRGCYLALRRAVRSPLAPRIAGVVLVEEPGRSLGARDVADVLGRPVLARVPAQASIARAVDAGVLAARLPEALARPATLLLDRLGLIDRAGRAA